MSDFRIVITNLPGFRAALRAAPRVLQREIGAAGERIADRGGALSRRYVPRLTGALAGTIWARSQAAGATVTAMWGATADYALPVDQGRRAVVITPKRGRFLRFEVDGAVVFARRVVQGARAGKPFVTRAFADIARGGYAREQFREAIRRTLVGVGRGSRGGEG